MAYCLSHSQALAQEEMRQRRQAQKNSELFALVMRRSQVSCQVGRMAGLEMARRLCMVSQAHGASLRRSLGVLSSSASPEVYVCGGQADRQTLATVVRFVESREVWEALPPMPTARSFCCCAAVGGKIYVFGGEKDQRAAFAAAECFDPVTGEWERLPPMPTPRAGCAAAVATGKMFVCGGLVMAHQIVDAVESFCPESRRWRRLPPMPTARCGCTAAGVGGRIFVMGGQLADGVVLDKVECLDLESQVWLSLSPMPSARSGLSAVLADGLVHLIGGLGSTGHTIPVVDRFDPARNEWKQPLAASVARAGFATGCAAGDRIYVVGGFGSDRQDSDKNELLDVKSGNVLQMPPLPLARRLCSGAVVVR
ncbi:unnamed protein product [Polarella glacialis]|uniref:Uncharacterized protein n=1 Tax=Polarella glacialis TaxID=89957 RepID=A0A813GKX4_POLGL|nr:unnamed protein product [Polarella glacialis]